MSNFSTEDLLNRMPSRRTSSSQDSFALSSPITPSGADAKDEDVTRLKSALVTTGDLADPSGYGLDPATNTALRAYQSRKGLFSDGIAKPGGETERNLDRDLQANAGLKPPAGQAPEDFEWLQGPGLAKNPEERKVQFAKVLLAQYGYYPYDQTLPATGIVTSRLVDVLNTLRTGTGRTPSNSGKIRDDDVAHLAELAAKPIVSQTGNSGHNRSGSHPNGRMEVFSQPVIDRYILDGISDIFNHEGRIMVPYDKGNPRNFRDQSIILAGGASDNLPPNNKAGGAHTVFKRNKYGLPEPHRGYKTYKWFPPREEFRGVFRYRGEGGPHFRIDPPLGYTAKPGKGEGSPLSHGRPAKPSEIPRNPKEDILKEKKETNKGDDVRKRVAKNKLFKLLRSFKYIGTQL